MIGGKKDQSGLHSFLLRNFAWPLDRPSLPRSAGFADMSGAVCVTAQLLFWPAKSKEVQKCLTERNGQKEISQSSIKPCFDRRLRVCLCVQMSSCVITDCAAVWGFVWAHAALWQQQPVITDLDCCLLTLPGLWRCTWEAAHTCPDLAWVLNWFIGPWFDALSWL